MFTLSNAFFPYIGAPGLSVALDGGVVINNGSSTFIAAQTISLAANSTTYIFLNTSAITVQSNTSGFTASDCYPIAIVTTTTDSVTTILDMRPDIQGGSSSGGGSVSVNGSTVANPNFNDTTPTAPVGGTNVTWQVSGSSISAYLNTSSFVTGAAGNTGDIQFNNAGAFDATDNFTWDVTGEFGVAVVGHQNAGFFLTDNLGADTQLLGVGIEVDASGTVSGGITALDVFTNVSGTANFQVRGIRVAANIVSAVQYVGIDITGPSTGATVALGARFSSWSNSGNVDSRAIQVLDGNIEFASGTALLAGNTFVDPTDQTRGFLLNFGEITSGNIWNVNIPDADSSTAQNAAVSPGQALAGFDVSSGNWTYVNVGSGTVTSFSAGALSPLFTTSVATATTTPALTFALSNAGGGTVFGNNTTSAAAPAYTIAPVLGIPGTSTGTIALASSTASGKFTITAPASSATPTLTLPTTSNVLAGQLAGDNVIYATTLQVTSAAGTLTIPSPQNQNANIVFAGPSSGGAATPSFRALVAADIPSGANLPLWSNLQNAAADLTLANAGFNTTFNQTSAATWTWANTTAATSSVSQSSPIHSINGKYWDGAASQTDSWTVQNVVANGTNGTSKLTFTHTGTSGVSAVSVPAGTLGTSGAWGLTFNGTTVGLNASGSVISLLTSSGNSNFRFYSTSTLTANIGSGNGSTQDFSIGVQQATNSMWIGDTGNNIRTGVGAILAIGQQQNNQWKPTAGGPAYGVTIGGGKSAQSVGFLGFAPASGAVKGIAFSVEPTVNQTGTASGDFTVFQMNLTNTAFLGTNLLLADWQLGGTSQFKMTSVGVASTYAATALVRQGIPSEIGTAVDSTAQTAAIAATNIIASAPRTGMYRVSWSATITTAASTSSVLGGTNGFQVGFTSPTDSVAKTVVAGNSTTSAANTTSTAVAGSYAVYAKTGTAITYSFDYTSVGVTAMSYELHVALEAM